MSKIEIVCLLILASFRGFAEPELKGTPPELTQYLAGTPKIVSVTGEGAIKVAGDFALVSLKATSESRSLQEALRVNQEARGRLVNYLQKQQIPADRVQASKFSSTPKFGLFGEKAKSYKVEN